MTHMNKFLGLLMAFAFAAFALPASAAQSPTKQYSLDITLYPAPSPGNGSVVSLPAGGGRVNWTIKNETPSGGNSAVSSFIIKKQPGVHYANPAGAIFDLVTLNSTGDLKVSGFSPLVPKQDNGTHSVTIGFDLLPDDPCTAVDILWEQAPVNFNPLKVTVHTGNFSNTTFAWVDVDTAGPPVVNLNQETTIASGVCHPVTGVTKPDELFNAVGNLVSCKTVLDGTNSTCTAQATSGWFLNSFSDNCAPIPATNKCTVGPIINDTTVVTGYYSQSRGQVGCISGKVPNTGTVNNYDSSLGKLDHQFDPDGSNIPFSDGWGLRRGTNKDDAPCVLVDFAFTPAASGNGFVASLLFDQTSGQKASWKYLIVWPDDFPVDSSDPTKGWTSFRPSVSWGIANPTAGTTDFVPALFCTDTVDDVDITTLTGAQLAARLPVIPDDSAISGPFSSSPHAQFKPGQTAKVCIVRNGVATGPNTLFPFTEVLDEADTYLTPK